MGQTTPNIGIFIPANGETAYGSSFAQGMINVDQHDHTGGPTKGVPIGSAGISDGSITFSKFNSDVVDPSGGLAPTASSPNGLKTQGLLASLYSNASLGFLVQSSSGVSVSRTLVAGSGITISNPQGIAGNPTIAATGSGGGITSTKTDLITVDTTPFTFDVNMQFAIIEVIAGGGGGGGAAISTGISTAGGGGGAGGYAKAVYSKTILGASQNITIGVGGTGGVAGATGGGGTPTVVGGSLVSASGGGGGVSIASSGSLSSSNGGGGGLGLTGDFLGGGDSGTNGMVSGTSFSMGGNGGASVYGASICSAFLNTAAAVVGTNGFVYGSGGCGAAGLNSASPANGGDGVDGMVLITQFIS